MCDYANGEQISLFDMMKEEKPEQATEPERSILYVKYEDGKVKFFLDPDGPVWRTGVVSKSMDRAIEMTRPFPIYEPGCVYLFDDVEVL